MPHNRKSTAIKSVILISDTTGVLARTLGLQNEQYLLAMGLSGYILKFSKFLKIKNPNKKKNNEYDN